MLCRVDQFFEAACQCCRSCTIPCRLSKAVCKDMGCEGYYAPTTTQLQAVVNDRRDNGIWNELLSRLRAASKERHEIQAAVNGDAMYTHVCMWAPITAALLLLIGLIVVLIMIKKGRWPLSNKQKYVVEISQPVINSPESKGSQLCCTVSVADGVGKGSRNSSQPLLPDISESTLKPLLKEGTMPADTRTDDHHSSYYGSAPKYLW